MEPKTLIRHRLWYFEGGIEAKYLVKIRRKSKGIYGDFPRNYDRNSHRSCSAKKLFVDISEISQNSQQTCEVSKNTFFTERAWVTASVMSPRLSSKYHCPNIYCKNTSERLLPFRFQELFPETLIGVQRGQSYLMGRRCLFSLGWPPF